MFSRSDSKTGCMCYSYIIIAWHSCYRYFLNHLYNNPEKDGSGANQPVKKSPEYQPPLPYRLSQSHHYAWLDGVVLSKNLELEKEERQSHTEVSLAKTPLAYRESSPGF